MYPIADYKDFKHANQLQVLTWRVFTFGSTSEIEQFAHQKDLNPKSVWVIFLDEALNDRTVSGFNTKAVEKCYFMSDEVIWPRMAAIH